MSKDRRKERDSDSNTDIVKKLKQQERKNRKITHFGTMTIWEK